MDSEANDQPRIKHQPEEEHSPKPRIDQGKPAFAPVTNAKLCISDYHGGGYKPAVGVVE